MDLKWPGKYCVFIQINNPLDLGHKKAVLSIWSSKQINTKVVSHKEEFLSSVMKSCAIKKGKKNKLAPGIYEYHCFSESGIFYSSRYYLNFSTEFDAYIMVKYKGDPQKVLLLPPFECGKPEFKIEVPHNSEKTIVLKIDPQCQNIEYSSRILIKKPKKVLFGELEEGLLQEIKHLNLIQDVELRVYEHDLGMIFAFRNTTGNKYFIGRFSFILTNLNFEDKKSDFEISLKPQNIEYKWAFIENPFDQGTKFNLRYTYETKKLNLTKEEIIKELKDAGKKTELRYKEGALWTKYVDGDYYLFIQSKTSKKLNVEIKFNNPVNLSCMDGDVWKVCLTKVNAGELKCLNKVKPFDNCECGYTLIQ